MEKIIQWRSRHLEVDTISHKIIEPTEDIQEYRDKDDSDDIYDNFDEPDSCPNSPKMITNTVFGQYELSDELHPYKEFRLWQADTNFKLTKRDWKNLVDTNGVEILIPITRYKFMVGVGKLFDFSKVRVDIEFALCRKHKLDIAINHIEDVSLKTKLTDIKSIIQDVKTWAIYIFPNGSVEYTTINNPDYKERLQLYKEAQLLSNGILIENG